MLILRLSAALAFTLGVAPLAPHAAAQAITILHQFAGGSDGLNPTSLLFYKGAFFGTTLQGGAESCSSHGCGTIFKFDPTTSTETILHAMDTAVSSFPISAVVGGGYVFGATSGSVFRLNPTNGNFKILYTFKNTPDGGDVDAPIMYTKGTIYGTTRLGGTNNLGTIFKVDATTGAETILYEFISNSDGYYPESNVVYGNGVIYGTTSSGAINNCGTVFKLDVDTALMSVVYSFTGSTDGCTPQHELVYRDGFVYGTTITGGRADLQQGTVFKVNVSSGSETTLQELRKKFGTAPVGIELSQGFLYGADDAGGLSGGGTVYKMNRVNGIPDVLYNFPGGGKSYPHPVAPPIDVGGTLYGLTTVFSTGYGTLYKLTH